MASYGVFTAACGYEYHGPKGHLAFAPRVGADDFRAPFTAAEGWGTFAQRRAADGLVAMVDVKRGRLLLRTFGLSTTGSYSLDHGRTWTAHPRNPILKYPERDPKVFWYGPGKHWVMMLYGAGQYHILTSPNLLDWTDEHRPIKDFRLEAPLFGREPGSVGAEDDRGVDGGEERGRQSLAATVVWGDQHVGGERLGVT